MKTKDSHYDLDMMEKRTSRGSWEETAGASSGSPEARSQFDFSSNKVLLND